MRTQLPKQSRDAGGAILALALLFLTVASLIVLPLANWTANDLNNTGHFASTRSLQATVESVTQTAIQSIRFTPLLSPAQTLNASPPANCWGTGAISQLTNLNGQSGIAVWCSTAWTPTSAATRVVTLSTCASSVSAAACALDPLLQAVVTFDDYAAGVNSPNPFQCVNTCGTVVTVNSWLWSPVAPSVTGLSPAVATPQNPITGGTSVTISGTGLLVAESVEFIEESGGVPIAGNVVVPATSFSVTSSTQITAVAPAVSDGTTYFVAVTTPTGTTAYGPVGTVFTYALVAPAVTALSTTQGSTAGGSSEMITGTGFVTASPTEKVNFVPESGGLANGTAVAATYVVGSPTSISAVSPAVTAPTTFYVQVVTAQGSSSTGPTVVFTYTSYTPTVASVTPTQGPGGTSVTITGTGFVGNATVNFVGESGLVPSASVILPAVVTAVTATSITVTAPGVTNGVTYFPEVTNPTMTTATGTSNPYPVFTAHS